ncbi:Lcl C-terminal domain-containing protein [Agarivorans sp. MS3-6]
MQRTYLPQRLSIVSLGIVLCGCNGIEGIIDSSEEANDVLDFNLADTGQVNCLDNDGAVINCPVAGEDYFGQDAQYSGNPFSFTDNNDGTVSDNITGLMWQQIPDNRGLSYQEAVDYCNDLALAGYSDWRVPSTKELFSLSDFSIGWPYLDTSYFGLAGSVVSKDEQYWTEVYVGSTIAGPDSAAFGVNHGSGHIKAYASGQMGNYVRAVRGDRYGVNQFVNNDDGTITDIATGLMWAQQDSGYGMNWQEALAYATDSTLASYTDWRVPNIKELHSIVDYTHSPSAQNEVDLGPAIDTDFFDITELRDDETVYDKDYGYFWSSTSAYLGSDSQEYYYAWYVAFGTASDGEGNDFHGAGGVRFDTKYQGGALGEGGERYYNYVRLVRDAP